MSKYLHLVPKHMYADGSHEDVELPEGYTARIKLVFDDGHDTPSWEHSDGHGPVSEWTTRAKLPGERVLCTDRSSKRYYNFAEAIELAKKDGWDAPPYKTGTKGEQAARAVEADYQFLRSWCNDEWHYIGVCVSLLDQEGNEIANDSLWGVESCGDYWREVAAENIENALFEAREHERTENLRKAFA